MVFFLPNCVNLSTGIHYCYIASTLLSKSLLGPLFLYISVPKCSKDYTVGKLNVSMYFFILTRSVSPFACMCSADVIL